jgi:hypothetical protein
MLLRIIGLHLISFRHLNLKDQMATREGGGVNRSR